MSDTIAARITDAIDDCHDAHEACCKLIYSQVALEEVPSIKQILDVLQIAAGYTGYGLGHLDTQSLQNLWRHVFGYLMEDVLDDIDQHPFGDAMMKRIKKEYGSTGVPVGPFLNILVENPGAYGVYQECLELACQQMLKNSKPNIDNVKGILSNTPKFGYNISRLNHKAVGFLWDNVFMDIVPDALAKLSEGHRCSDARLENMKKKYHSNQDQETPKEEPYDNVVEDLYLTAVNDHETYKACVKEVQKLMFVRKRKLPAGRVRYVLKGPENLLLGESNAIQQVKAWLKIFDHLQEAAIYELESECMCAEEELESIKRHYVPGYNQGTVTRRVGMSEAIDIAHEKLKDPEALLREIEEHKQKAQQHFDAVDQSLLEIKMSSKFAKTPVTKVTYIYGTDIEECSAEELMSFIKRAKHEIENLQDAGIKSSYVEEQSAGLTSAIDIMVAKLDTL